MRMQEMEKERQRKIDQRHQEILVKKEEIVESAEAVSSLAPWRQEVNA